ncbi:MAG: cysteine synthase family protein [Acidimicrobiia bacterium]
MTTTRKHQRLSSDADARRYTDIRELLPDVLNPTPLVRLNRIEVALRMETFVKLEWMSPFGSIKDRTARFLVAGLAERGQLADHQVIEASSGNTAIALAALGALDGFRVTATIPDGVPEEKKIILRMLGAEVWETPDDVCPVDHPKDGAIALARSLLVSDESYVMADQYENLDNIKAHYETTGPEIWAQTEGQVRWFLAGLGTTGTLTGVGRYLKEQNPSIQIIGVEPEPGHRIPGMKNFDEAKAPGIADWSVIDEIIRVNDEPAYETTKRLWREEALMVGPSTGAVIAAIEQLDPSPDDVAVAISADSGMKYTSYFRDILGDEGIPPT